MAALRTLVICATSASLVQGQGGAEIRDQAVRRHTQHYDHSAEGGSRRAIPRGPNEEDIQIAIEARGDIRTLARREAADEDANPTPRPFLLAEQEQQVEKAKDEENREEEQDRKEDAHSGYQEAQGMTSLEEPHVWCGTHNAPECAACPLDHGANWCHGDCLWDKDTTTCRHKHKHTGKTLSTEVRQHPAPIIDEEQISKDAIADTLRQEQEAVEEQERIDRKKFWLTAGIAAGGSACMIMICGVVSICVMKSRDKSPKAMGAQGAATKMLEEPEVMEDEMFTVVTDSADVYDSCEGDEKIGTLSKDESVYAAGPPVQGRLPIKAPGGATGAVDMSALQKQEAGWEGEEQDEET